MIDTYYFDTSIWIDIYDKRGYNGEVAKKLMEKIILHDRIVLYSEVIIAELKKLGFFEDEINALFRTAKPDHIRMVHVPRNQILQARKLAKQRAIPWRDALHALIARNHDAQFVSRDLDFEKLRDITMAKKPEDLLDT